MRKKLNRSAPKRAPKAKARPRPVLRPRIGPRRRAGVSVAKLWHPVFGSNAWVPRCLASTPTIRVRDYATFTVTTGGNPVGGFIGPLWRDVSLVGPALITNAVGSYGVAAQAPLTGSGGDTLIATRQGPNFPISEARLHRIGVTVSCLGATAVGSLLPASYCRIGCMRGKVDPTTLVTWSAMVTWLESQSAMHTFSAYSLMTKSRHVASHPLDFLGWCQLRETVGPVAGTTMPLDTLAPICFVLGASGTADNYQFTLHLEWDLLVESGGAGTLLASAHVLHPTLPDALLHSASNLLAGCAGHVEELGVGAAAGAATALRATASFIPPAVDALADIAPLVAL
jgi:hypothetical protein